jgi:2-keto-3-deoxygluconate permease
VEQAAVDAHLIEGGAVMADLPIKRTIERIPGGMMIVPLFTGAVLLSSLEESTR